MLEWMTQQQLKMSDTWMKHFGVKVSISPTFYKQIFVTFWEAFLYYQFGFVFFSRENMCTKSARKMLLTLTTQIVIKEIKNIYLSHIFQFESDPHILKFLRNLTRVAKRFSHLIADPIAYKMMLLLLLTMENRKMSKLSALQKQYLQMLWRKLNHTFIEMSSCYAFVKDILHAIHFFQLLTDSMLQLLS